MANAARAHCLMLTPEGRLHPIVLTGYLADPSVPLDFFREVVESDVVAARRTDWGARESPLATLAVYSAVRRPDNPDKALFNPFGSFLAGDCGFEAVPLYGNVFFCRVPDPQTGIIAKLSGALKDLIAFKLLTAQAIFEGIRLDYISEENYRQAWARLALIVRTHRQECEIEIVADNVLHSVPDGSLDSSRGSSLDGSYGDVGGNAHGGGRDAEDALSSSS